jgi:hypothetical protein
MAKRKAGQNAVWCKAYKSSHRREKNKLRKVQKHLKLFPDDQVALETIERLKKAI